MVYPPTDGHPSSGVARLLKVGEDEDADAIRDVDGENDPSKN